jgi:hypothetical protein
MSYQYRKKKRDLCHQILSHQELLDLILDSHSEIDEFENRAPTISDFTKWYPDCSYPELQSAINLLIFNKHMSEFYDREDPHEASPPYLIPTLEGIEAYNEGYYEKENQKDRLESIEVYTKWILPIISLLISIVALLKK